MFESARCMWMRGGTSKGAYFLANDLPTEIGARDAFLLRIMGSPDPRQIDGMGGADPLTSKVAIVNPSTREGIDVEYLFLQVMVDKSIVTDVQNCGNILAGVGAFSIERELLKAQDGKTTIRIFMLNTEQVATQTIHTPDGKVTYRGDTHIDGVPETASPVAISFEGSAGASCGALLPTGQEVNTINGIDVTCIDNGMPCVVMRATDMGISGNETREELDNNEELKRKLESIRLQAGPMMNLGDVTDKTVPKMSMVSPASNGGAVSTRTFIPHRCHASIGVLGAVSVATACLMKNSPAYAVSSRPNGNSKEIVVEHASGSTTVVLDINAAMQVTRSAVVRTTRKLFDGVVYAS